MQEAQVGRRAISTKFIVLIVLIVIAIVGGIVYKQYRDHVAHSPEVAGNTFMTAVTQKDGASSYAMFTDGAKKKLSDDDWNAWVVFTFDKYSGGVPAISKKEVVPDPRHEYSKDNDTATRLRYEIPFSDKTYSYDIILVKAGDTWKVGSVGGLQ
jgi:uncharacterized membrane protein YvbJ